MRFRLLGVLPLVLGLVGLGLFVAVVHKSDPLSGWFAWRVLRALACAAVWATSCLSFGYFLLRQFPALRFPPVERLIFSFSIGMLGWALSTVAVGLVHGLGTVWFFVQPAAFLALGAPSLLHFAGRWRRSIRTFQVRRSQRWGAVLTAFGSVCLALLYVGILSPRTVMYDAQWYHLPIAEQYAAAGAVFEFREGWLAATLPHLATWVYTWAFSSPFGQLFDRIELAVHLEVAVVAITLSFVGALFGRLLPRPRLAGSWALRFVFPGILLYDSSPGGGSDHFLALWAVPLFLAFLRLWRTPSTSNALLFGTLTGAAVLTRYQALFLITGPLIALGFRAALSVLQRPSPFLRPFGLTLLAALVVSAPHWLLNSIWHHNPVYPALSSLFPSTPMAEGVDPHVDEAAWKPKGTPSEKLLETAGATFSFGFVAHDWDTFHGTRPTYGSLFLIALALLPFARRKKALLALALFAWVAVPVWYWTHHQDRYLQAIAPWCSVFVGVVFIDVWRRWTLARPAIAGLVAFQLLHVSDIVTLPSHAMIFRNPLVDAFELVASKDPTLPDQWVDQTYPLARADTLVPKEAKVLVHEAHLHLGLRRPAVHDNLQRQAGIAYHVLGDTGSVVELMRSYGVTHVVWSPNPAGHSLIGEDLVFHRFVQHAVQSRQQLGGGFLIGAMAESFPKKDQTVMVLTCTTERLTPKQLEKDWHRLYYSNCEVPPTVDLAAFAETEDVVVVDTRRYPGAQPGLAAKFDLLFERNGFHVWSRRPGA